MKIYLAGVESHFNYILDFFLKNNIKLYWNLSSYYVLNKLNKTKAFKAIKELSEGMLIDSGAFTLQRNSSTVDWKDYTKKYANFIKKYDDEKITGFFEMDVDNIIGYENVLKLRRMLEDVSDKIIPVWHRNRGISEFKKMCRDYDYVSITGKANDITKEQFKLFVDYAHKNNTRIHGLGIQSKKILNNIPFDSVDGTNWLNGAQYAKFPFMKKQFDSNYLRQNVQKVIIYGYLYHMKCQEHYFDKWRNVCNW